MNVYVALEFVFQGYTRDSFGPGRSVWVSVMPHVLKQDFRAWLANAMTGAGATYLWWDNSAAHGAAPYQPMPQADDLVAVPFAGELDLALRLTRTAGPPFELTNPRSSAPAVLDADAFERANRPEGTESLVHDASPRTNIPKGPFAKGIAHHLVALADATPADLADASDFLRMLFWGGTRRTIPPRSMAGLSDDFVMYLDGSAKSDTKVVNNHGLCGLLFRLAVGDGDAKLANVTDVELRLTSGGAPAAPPLVLSAAPNLRDSVAALFADIPRYDSSVPVRGPSLTWDGTFDRRVYVRDSLTAFYPTTIGGGTVFRRRATDATDDEHQDLSRARRVVVAAREVPAQGAPVLPLPTANDLQWRCLYAYDATLTPYKAPPKGAPAPQLLVLRPRSGQERAFYKEFGGDGPGNAFPAPRGLQPLGADFVGCYRFPWNTNGSLTVLFHGMPRADPNVSVVFDRQVTLTTTLAPQFRTPVWAVTITTAQPAVRFNVLRYVGPPDPAIENVVAGIAFENDVTFEMGQSISHIEGHITAAYLEVPLTHALSEITVSDELKHDLLNYNALNVYLAGGIELTKHSELYPLAKNANGTINEFVFRKKRPAFAPPFDWSSTATAFFADVYGRAGRAVAGGTGWKLDVDLENTYGLTQPELGPEPPDAFPHAGLDAVLDFLPTNPARVGMAPGASRSAGTEDVADATFVSVEYDYDAVHGELATLVFQTPWLQAALSGGETADQHVNAWRSVYELAHAETLELVARGYGYDFRNALPGSSGTASVDSALAQCLVPLPEQSVDVTAELQRRAAGWIRGGTFSDAERVPISLAPLGRLGDRTVVLEFSLRMTRPDSLIADDPATFAFMQSLERRPSPDATGTAFDDGFSVRDGMAAPFASWRAGMKQTDASIPFRAPEATRQKTAFLRQAFGARPDDTDAAKRHSSWLFPQLAGAPGPKQDAAPQILECPVTFRPFANDPLLGDQTFLLVARYMRALELVQAGQVREAPTRTAAEWTAYFNRLANAFVSGPTTLADVHREMVRLVQPTPPVQSIGSTPIYTPPAIANLVNAINANATAGRAVDGWIENALWLSPSVFGDTKSFMLSAVRDAGGPLTGSFGEMRTGREVTHRDAGTDVTTVEVHSLSYREAIPLDDAHQMYGFIELLDEVRYGDEVTFGKLNDGSLGIAVSPYHALLAELYRVTFPNETALPLPAPSYHVPQIVVPDSRSGPDLPIKLAAREAIVPPVHIVTGSIEQVGRPSEMQALLGKPISDRQLRSGMLRLVDVPTEDADVLVASGAVDLPPLKVDQAWLSAVFSIEGDEGFHTDWIPSFLDDDFIVGITTAPSAGSPPPAVLSGARTSGDASKLFEALKNFPDPATIKNLDTMVLAPDALTAIRDIVATPPTKYDVRPGIATFRIGGTSAAPSIFDTTATSRTRGTVTGDPRQVVVHLFRSALSPLTPPRAYVLVAVLVTVWEQVGITLQQRRNADLVFDPAFQQASAAITDVHLARPTSFKCADGAGATVHRRAMSARELLTTFFDGQFSNPAAPFQYNLSITVHAAQRRSFPQDYPRPNPTALTPLELETTKFPYIPFTFTKNTNEFDQPKLFFGDQRFSDFMVDFQWLSNKEFLRIEDCSARTID